jgi:hypothetical protein
MLKMSAKEINLDKKQAPQWAVYSDEGYPVKMYERLPPNCPWPSGVLCGPYDEPTHAEFAKRLIASGLNCPQIDAVMPTFIKLLSEVEQGYVAAVTHLTKKAGA